MWSDCFQREAFLRRKAAEKEETFGFVVVLSVDVASEGERTCHHRSRHHRSRAVVRVLPRLEKGDPSVLIFLPSPCAGPKVRWTMLSVAAHSRA